MEQKNSGLPLLGLAIFLLALPVFWIFSYNSGYGYDQLEYLLLGKVWSQGMPFYTYHPSKSVGIFALVAVIAKSGVSLSRACTTTLITLVYAAIVSGTYFGVRRWIRPGPAVLAAILVGICAAFMELNFLETEGLVYLAALPAFHCLLLSDQRKSVTPAAIAGLFLALSAHFKSVALLYLAAGVLFIVIQGFRRHGLGWIVRAGMLYAICFVAGVLAVGLYFGLTGRGGAFWRWSFVFPAIHYPSNTFYIHKLYSKLLGIHLIFLAAMAISLSPRRRSVIYGSPPAVLALCMGLFGYVAVLKCQASHYCFPGAAFLSIFSACVFSSIFAPQIWHQWRLRAVIAGAGLMALMAVSTWLYRPDAFARLARLKDFSREESPAIEMIHRHAGPDDRVLLFRNSTKLYFLSGRYPPPPYINNDEKTTWAFRNDIATILQTLDDPKLSLVEFDPRNVLRPALEDPGFGRRDGDRKAMAEFLKKLEERFVRCPDSPAGYVFWKRAAR